MSGTHAAKPPHSGRPRSWLVRAAAAFRQDPVQALRRGDEEAAEATDLGLGVLIAVVASAVAVIVYVLVTVGPVVRDA